MTVKNLLSVCALSSISSVRKILMEPLNVPYNVSVGNEQNFYDIITV